MYVYIRIYMYMYMYLCIYIYIYNIYNIHYIYNIYNIHYIYISGYQNENGNEETKTSYQVLRV